MARVKCDNREDGECESGPQSRTGRHVGLAAMYGGWQRRPESGRFLRRGWGLWGCAHRRRGRAARAAPRRAPRRSPASTGLSRSRARPRRRPVAHPTGRPYPTVWGYSARSAGCGPRWRG
eukprot:6161289-Prymnesium_polylepis.1